jgi:hypothetical protein
VILVSSGETVTQETLVPDSQAANGIVSPVNGTVVQWRIRTGAQVGPVAVRVVRPLGGNLFTGAGTASSLTPPANATTAFPAQLPISIGDRLGLDCCNGDGNYFVISPGSVRLHFAPPLVNGDPGRPPDSEFMNREVAINADIEPTNTFTLGTVTRNKKKGTATLTVENLPNPGELTGSGNGVKASSADRAATSKSVGAGQAQLLIKAKGKKKRKLNKTGKVKLTVAISYTPSGGSPNTQSLKVKLKKKL